MSMTAVNATADDAFSDHNSREAWESAESILGDDDVSFTLHNQQSGDGEKHYAAQVNCLNAANVNLISRKQV
jgi:hypothetical protein